MQAPIKKSDRKNSEKVWAIYFTDGSESGSAYVKWRTETHAGKTSWYVGVSHTYRGASKYESKEMAERAIRGVPSFNGRSSTDSLTAYPVNKGYEN